MNQVLEGTWEEVSKQAATLKGTKQVRLEVIEEKPVGQMIKFGSIPTLRDITEEDFRSAEYKPKDLDW